MSTSELFERHIGTAVTVTATMLGGMAWLVRLTWSAGKAKEQFDEFRRSTEKDMLERKAAEGELYGLVHEAREMVSEMKGMLEALRDQRGGRSK